MECPHKKSSGKKPQFQFWQAGPFIESHETSTVYCFCEKETTDEPVRAYVPCDDGGVDKRAPLPWRRASGIPGAGAIEATGTTNLSARVKEYATGGGLPRLVG